MTLTGFVLTYRAKYMINRAKITLPFSAAEVWAHAGSTDVVLGVITS